MLYRENLDQGRRRTPQVYRQPPGRRRRPQTVDLEDLRPDRRARPSLERRTGRSQWADVDDDDVADAARGDRARAPARTSSTRSRAFPARRPNCPAAEPCAWDPAGPRPRGRRTATQNGVQAFYLVSRFHDHLAGDADRLQRRLGQLRGRRHRRRRSGADPDRRRRRHRRRRRAGRQPRQQRQHGDAARRPVADDADVPVPGQRLAGRRSTSATSTAATTPASSGTSTPTASPTAWSPTPTARARSAPPHAGAMGEAWSDWYALRPPGPRRPQDRHRRHARRDRRRRLHRPRPARAAHARRSTARSAPSTRRCPGGPATGDRRLHARRLRQDRCGGPEVHADGEIWAETLWDLRQALRSRPGRAAALRHRRDARHRRRCGCRRPSRRCSTCATRS